MLNHLSVSLTRLGRGDRQRFSTSHPSKFKVSTRNERKNFLFSLSLYLSLSPLFCPPPGLIGLTRILPSFTEFFRDSLARPGTSAPSYAFYFFNFLLVCRFFLIFISTSIDHSRPILSFMVESCFGRVHL